MTYVETRTTVWDAWAGRASGEQAGPTDPGRWGAVLDRLNPARARPVLRAGIEAVRLTSARGTEYVLLRSPEDGARASYLRLTPEQWQLAVLMDGTVTVARLVAEFTRIAGRLAPDQVRRVVADLAGNLMLDELPMEAFQSQPAGRREQTAERRRGSLLAAAGGRRVRLVGIDGLITALYRAGGRLLFGRAAAVVFGLFALVGVGVFITTWSDGSQSLFLLDNSYLLGAISLVLLNLFVVAVRELSRALAAKHHGREVPAAGLLVCLGLPSIFVETSDVWMAGRRARLAVAAAGPVSALMAAGAVQLFALVVPAIGGLAFKLAFLFYLQAFVNLSPLLPLDGYHLLIDWLEIPGLRARGLSWVSGQFRRRSARWSALDHEGRLVALYGLLAVVWFVLASASVVLLWTDRLSGLATGLLHAGVLGFLLFVLIGLGLAAPVRYFLVRTIGLRWRRWRQQRAERDREADAPRRLIALRAGELGGLSEQALHALAAEARWVHPAVGRQLIRADSWPEKVYLVVRGAVEGRRAGDPTGTIRHRVGPGGVIGLADLLTGRPAHLDWYAAGATLLAVPNATAAKVIGALPGPTVPDRLRAEELFDDTPAIAGLARDQQLALITSAHPVELQPGAPVVLPGPTHAIVIESGMIAMSDGVELRRGTLIGPVGDGSPGVVAQTRTTVRLWVIPDASVVPPLVSTMYRPAATTPVPVVEGSPAGGAADAYPPLAVPAVPPEEFPGPELDRGFERRMWWLAAGVAGVALVPAVLTARPGPAWAEMPGNQALLTVERGTVTAYLDDAATVLTIGQRRYLSAGTRVEVSDRAGARLTFAGGAATLLCAGAQVVVDAVATAGGGQRSPAATVTLRAGRLLADTTSVSGAYNSLSLHVARAQHDVVNSGPAWFAVDPADLTVSAGKVSVDAAISAANHAALTCGDGVPVAPPAGANPSITGAPLPGQSVDPAAPSVAGLPDAPAKPTGAQANPLPGLSASNGTAPVSPAPSGQKPTPKPSTSRPTVTVPPTPAPTSKPPTGGPTVTPPPTPTTTPTPEPTTTPPGPSVNPPPQ